MSSSEEEASKRRLIAQRWTMAVASIDEQTLLRDLYTNRSAVIKGLIYGISIGAAGLTKDVSITAIAVGTIITGEVFLPLPSLIHSLFLNHQLQINNQLLRDIEQKNSPLS